ncbi:MAG: DUF2892 domain-containing protein [Formivibrio sp.]|nr:DUF2892 domain-containing protein [Formivibrio sp.]
MCNKNVGGFDRIARAIIGLVLLGLMAAGTIGAWGWLGLVPLATAVFGFCPLYKPLGINTCSIEKK